MSRLAKRAVSGTAACLIASPLPGFAQSAAPAPATPQPGTNIFDPERAPVIVIHIGARRIVLTPTPQGGSTTISAAAIAQKANQSFNSIITSSIAGAAASSSGEIHIRGSHGQYTYYLDGAPLPSSVSGSFGELIDPKNIEALKVYTGGFPARYGGNLAAVFDVAAKGGSPGGPRGYLQQSAGGFQSYETTAQAGGGQGAFSYFVSGVNSSSNRRLDPVSPSPIHDAGSDSVLFTHDELKLGAGDRLILDAAKTRSTIQIPNLVDSEVDEQAAGRNDVQRENGDFANLVWRRTHGLNSLVAAFYSHSSRLRFDPSVAPDLALTGSATTEDRNVTYDGFRTDYTIQHGKRQSLQFGFDVSAVTGHERFQIETVPADSTAFGAHATVPASVLDSHAIGGNDFGAYISHISNPGRWTLDAGLRYDSHKAQNATSQVSPRINATYTLSATDKVHAYYNRLFQPAAIEDVRALSGSTVSDNSVITPINPERDDFYEVGWLHHHHGTNISVSGYYKTAKDVIDDQPLGNTQIEIPINITKGYVRGIEFAVDTPVTKTVTAYANYARAWAKAAGVITGGVANTDPPADYFPEDHDQTDTASVGLSYDNAGTYASLDGEYGSGFPYQDDDGIFRRVSPHFIFNGVLGHKIGAFDAAFTVDNILNHPYIIKQAGTFTDREYGAGRSYGVRLTFKF